MGKQGGAVKRGKVKTLVEALGSEAGDRWSGLGLDKLVVGRAGLTAEIVRKGQAARARAMLRGEYRECVAVAAGTLARCMAEEGVELELGWMLMMDQGRRAAERGEDVAEGMDVLGALFVELMEGPGLGADAEGVRRWARGLVGKAGRG